MMAYFICQNNNSVFLAHPCRVCGVNTGVRQYVAFTAGFFVCNIRALFGFVLYIVNGQCFILEITIIKTTWGVSSNEKAVV